MRSVDNRDSLENWNAMVKFSQYPILPRGLLVFSFVDAAFMSLIWVIEAPYLKVLGFTPLEYGILGSVMAFSTLISLSVTG